MQSKKLAGPKPGPATQRYLDISEIKDDVVVMKDGTLRAVLLVSSINFSLKSEDEQNAIIQQYMSFLNSLEFPLQIVIQSRQLNIDKYLDRLKESEKAQTNELLRLQINDYRAFIKELVSLGQIMQKSFFVTVPYNPLSDTQKGFFARLSESFSPVLSVKLAEDRFRQRRDDLMKRVDNISGNLGSMGLKSSMLDTQGLIELYYRVYNPEIFDVQKMVDTDQLRVTENPATV
ncbi:MAG: TraC family protein [Patescibacteria group bacterium]